MKMKTVTIDKLKSGQSKKLTSTLRLRKGLLGTWVWRIKAGSKWHTSTDDDAIARDYGFAVARR